MTRLVIAAALCVCLFPTVSSAQGVPGPLLASSGRVAAAMSGDPSIPPTLSTSHASNASGRRTPSIATMISVGVAGAFIGFLAGAKIGGSGGSEGGAIGGAIIGAGVGAAGLVILVSHP